MFDMMRESLVTKEKMIDHYKKKYKRINGCYDSIFDHSLNDNLESFFDKMKLGQVTNETALNFWFPKLTEREMRLVELKDKNHMSSYAATDDQKDVSEAEMKLSDSKSKFVYVYCTRITFVLNYRPITKGQFKRSIESCEQWKNAK